MSSATGSQFVSKDDAQLVCDAGEGVIKLVVQLSALGLNASALLEYCTAVADGEEPSASLGVGRPKPVTIQLNSFLHDSKQFHDIYDISHPEATELLSLLSSDPQQCRERVFNLVSNSPRLLNSGRAVEISMLGLPGASSSGPSPLTGASSVTRSYAREIASNSGVYGAYKFEAFDTHREETQRYAVDLGANFFVMTQSKKLSISVARICSLKGREHHLVVPYVYYVDRNHRCLTNGDISNGAWSCKRGPRDSAPSVSSRTPPPHTGVVSEAIPGKEATSTYPVTEVGHSEKK